MKNGIYNIQLNNVQLTGMESPEEALLAVARMIIEMHENEEQLEDVAMEMVEEFDPQYEIDENDCSDDELNFDQAS